MRPLFSLGCAATILAFASQGEGSDWQKSPRPKFPDSALQKFSEGLVKLRAIIAQDGSVREVILVKSSGDPALDEAAQKAISKWRMEPTAIKAQDLVKGREVTFDFKEEAHVAAVYRDRHVAYFHEATEKSLWRIWMFAPFPSYSEHARRFHRQGTVRIYLRIGKDGRPEDVKIAQSSGFKELDDSVLRAVQEWRAHNEYAGTKIIFPITFQLMHR
ncbi:MAG: energy transducer TonB [Chthoniobacterales bacterium]